MEITPELLQETLETLEYTMKSVVCSRETLDKILPTYKKLVGMQARSARRLKTVFTFNGIVITRRTLHEIKELLKQQKKIEAIKHMRAVAGKDLKQSKDAVDQIQTYYHLNY